MYKVYNFLNFIISPDVTVLGALERINENKCSVIFICDKNKKILGSITDGDVRRLLIENKLSLNCEVSLLMNSSPIVWDRNSHLDKRLLSLKLLIPFVDNKNQVLYFYSYKKPSFLLGDYLITDTSKAFTIAEIGNNHQGNLSNAFKLIDEAKLAGADCVKFQHRNLEVLYSQNIHQNNFSLGAQYVYDLINKFQLSKDDLYKCFEYCKSININFTCTPFDASSLNDLLDYNIKFLKISSSDFCNYEMLDKILENKIPFILSSGMYEPVEIIKVLSYLNNNTNEYIVMHCNSSYPAPYCDVQIKFLDFLKIHGSGYVGYSSHDLGLEVSIAAVALGAQIIEKHFTLDKNQEGNDHKVSLLPHEFNSLVSSIRNVESALGSSSKSKYLSQGEKQNKLSLGKGFYASYDLNIGYEIQRNDFKLQSPLLGVSSDEFEYVNGSRLTKKISKGEALTYDHFSDEIYNFSGLKTNFYIPVRHNDVQSLIYKTGIKNVEFHLSYKDLSLDINTIPWHLINNFSVHIPELFENDHILDLASDDEVYRAKSIDHIMRSLDFATEAINKSKYKSKVNCILNAGGATDYNKNFTSNELEKKYCLVNDGVKLLQDQYPDIIICIQTMPPFPWHFGGNRFHNLFVHYEEIEHYSNLFKWDICLDTSHTMMTCNEFNYKFSDFVERISSRVAHIHLADCKGSNGEGIKTGFGEFNFIEFKKIMLKHFNSLPVVLEEWEGHMNAGIGFIESLSYLEKSGY